jgi:DNA-binding HxlR family transcriptional regulator
LKAINDLGSCKSLFREFLLKHLESEKIVKRKVFKEIPLHVEYSLTSRGQSLKGILEKMDQWGQTA